MRRFFLAMLLAVFACYQTYDWFKSSRYPQFLERHKKKAWVPRLLLKSGLYWTFFDDPSKALLFFDRCAKEDLKKAPERPLCLYYKAWCHDEKKQFNDAIQWYSLYLEEFPKHAKADLAQRRLDVLSNGWSGI